MPLPRLAVSNVVLKKPRPSMAKVDSLVNGASVAGSTNVYLHASNAVVHVSLGRVGKCVTMGKLSDFGVGDTS